MKQEMEHEEWGEQRLDARVIEAQRRNRLTRGYEGPADPRKAMLDDSEAAPLARCRLVKADGLFDRA
jgi:hypothetical protein